MKYHPYPTYKETGFNYLETIPDHWMAKQLKRTVDGCTNGIWGAEPIGDGGDTIVLRVADFDRQKLSIKLDKITYRKIEDSEKIKRKLKKGDLLIEKSGGGEKTLVGQVVLFDKDIDAVTSNFVAKMTPLQSFDSAYLNYVFARFYVEKINYCSIKQNTGIQNLDSSQYLSEKFAFPGIEEQKQIATFLDGETQRIDGLIEKQQQLIKLLQEKRQAVISHAVTKGLNPDAEKKNSGIEWLGEVPKHWIIKRLKHISPRVGVGLVINPSTYTTDEGVYYIFGGDVKEFRFDLSKTRRMKPEDSDKLQASRLSKDDLVSVRVGYPGITAVVTEGLEGANCASVIITRKGKYNSHWLCAAMNADIGKFQVNVASYGAAQKQYNVSDAIEFWFPVPPIREQEEIAEYVHLKLEESNQILSKAMDSIRLLKERRTALISAAVTGKIDVRNVA